MTNLAIRVEGLSKLYRLGALQRRNTSFREALTGALRKPSRWLRQWSGQINDDETFWALDDVSFEVQAGETIGVIGRNGAGKSTLLRVLSRITEPTCGRIELWGRVGSLLEVGTGFHPELTGRENIYLNGAILGMSRIEVQRKFDEIVAFAEVDRFLDTQVKHYSSGMYMRLAFAVAAHLQPDILIVDEVLAVGDAAFQKKCLGKMGDVARGGRTVLFVSHNMAAVAQLCSRTILLRAGKIECIGNTADVTDSYMGFAMQNGESGERDLTLAQRTGGDGKIRFTRVILLNQSGEVTTRFGIGEPITIRMQLESDIFTNVGEVGFTIRTISEIPLFTSSSTDSNPLCQIAPGHYQLQCRLDPNHLRPGVYWIQLGTTCGALRDLIPEAIQFSICDSHHYSHSHLHALPGHIYFPFAWTALTSISDEVASAQS
jgi:lipopolysaccharide transport system ATP-binding protein